MNIIHLYGLVIIELDFILMTRNPNQAKAAQLFIGTLRLYRLQLNE